MLKTIADVARFLAIAWGCFMFVGSLQAQTIRLNEVLTDNKSWTNSAGQVSDWVELHNAGAAKVDIADMSLSDGLGSPRRWVFPAGVTIPSDGLLIVFFAAALPASTNLDGSGRLNAGFGLKSSGGAVYLFDSMARSGGLVDAVVYGLQAPDLAIGRMPGESAWRLTRPTPGAPNAAVPMGEPAALRINEWMASPSAGDDYFELYNPAPQPVALGGLYLTDNLSNRTQHHIPALSFIGTEASAYALFAADGNTGNGADHTSFKLNAGGEAIGLFAADGLTAIDAVSFGPQTAGVSEGRFPDGSTNIVRLVDNPTPGRGNFYPLQAVVISEILSHADDPFEDAIELFNPTTGSVDLSGWYVSDNINKPKKYRIPAGTVLEPGGYTVFYRYQFQPTPGVSPSFAFNSAHGDELYVLAADAAGNLTGYRTGVIFGPAPNNVPFARYLASTGPQLVLVQRVQMGSAVVGSDPPEMLDGFRTGRGAPNAAPVVGPVVISEIMYHPPDLGTNDNAIDEFVELRSIVATNLPLFDQVYPSNHWSLRGAVDYTFTNDVWLAPGATVLLVNFDPVTNPTQLADFRSRYDVSSGVPIYGPYRGKLDNSGESLELCRPDIPQFCFDPDFGWVAPIPIDRIDYSDSQPWPSAADGTGHSLQRWNEQGFGNDPVNWYAGMPTAGAYNGSPAGEIPRLTQLEQAYPLAAGASITFAPGVTGSSNSFRWFHRGLPIPSATNASLTIAGAQPTNAGLYSVLVSNPYGAAETSCTLRIMAPPLFTSQPRDQVAPLGGTAIFLVTLEGTPPFRYQWRAGGTDIPGATNATLVLSNVQTANATTYAVAVSTSGGSATSASATLTLSTQNPPSLVVAPKGADYQKVTPVAIGSSFTLHAVVSGDAPIHFQWRKDDMDIPEATNATLTLQDYQPADNGSYTLEAWNQPGSMVSRPVVLTDLLAPLVSIEGPDSVAVDEGAGLVLQASATGTARLYYQWQVDGRDIVGELCSTLFAPRLSYNNAGHYTVILRNSGGRVTSAPVEVMVRPRILSVTRVGQAMHLTFHGTSGKSYRLNCSSNLLEWESVTTVLGGSGQSTVIQADAPLPPVYYRIELVP